MNKDFGREMSIVSIEQVYVFLADLSFIVPGGLKSVLVKIYT